MLHRIVQAYGGELPKKIKVIFCNTSKEFPQTLDFVERCSTEWGVKITWLEYHSESPGHFRKVTPETACRNGEVFEDFIRSRHIIPNAIKRVCTEAMKILPKNRYIKSLGWVKFHKDGNKRILDSGYHNAIGLRYDEPRRLHSMRMSIAENPSHIMKESLLGPVKVKSKKHKVKPPFGERPLVPIAEAKVSKPMIADWWKEQRGGYEWDDWMAIAERKRPGFDLELHPDRNETNCDGCFLKGARRLAELERNHPGMLDWWIQMEKEVGGLKKKFGQFNQNLSMTEIQEAARKPGQIPLFMADQYAPECELTCTD